MGDEVDKADFHEFKDDMKEFITERFDSHEEKELLMIKPLIDKVQEHDKILRGRSGRGGLVKDVNMFQWVASGGLLTAASKWISDFFSR
jgi:hypothetical protein